jgi:dUTP pyrophosphatase
MVIPGVIDEGWRGELFTMAYRPPGVRPVRTTDGYIPAGTRLAQLIVLPNLMRQVQLVQVDTLPESERGRRGFGSSGN